MSVPGGTAGLSGCAATLAYITTFAVTVVFLPRDALATRVSAAVSMAALTPTIYGGIWHLIPSRLYVGMAAAFLALGFLHNADLLLLTRVDAAQLSYEDHQLGTAGLLYRAACLSFNLRRVGTRWEVKRLGKSQPQSRTHFILMAFWQNVLTYLIIDFFETVPPQPEPHLIAPQKQTLFRIWDLSVEDFVFRLTSAVMFWLMGGLTLTLCMNCVAILTVLTGLSKPEAWPRLFGPLGCLYTVRGFWGRTWHQLYRETLVAWGDAIPDRIFRIPRGTLQSRYSRLFVAFLLSGLGHHYMDIVNGFPHTAMFSVKFFCLQPLGIMAEDAAQAATQRLPIPDFVRKAAGYIWTWFFMSWTTTLMLLPQVLQEDQSKVVPFSIIKQLLEMQK